MKRIYTFELDDDYASGDIKSDVSCIAYLLYEELKELEDYRGEKILALGNFLQENELFDLMDIDYRNKEVCRFSKFKNDYSENKSYIMFDPIMFSERSFGITVYEGTINSGDMQYLIEEIVKTLKKQYTFDITFVSYEDGMDKVEEIRHRRMAIEHLHKPQIKESFLKKTKLPVFKRRPV